MTQAVNSSYHGSSLRLACITDWHCALKEPRRTRLAYYLPDPGEAVVDAAAGALASGLPFWSSVTARFFFKTSS